LLGQTVNAYGRHDFRRGRAEKTGTMGFGALLRRLGEIPGIARLRYTSPHPIFFDNDLVQAHGDLPALCPHVHLPVQSGSDPVLARMRRRYTAADYRGLIAALRAVRPDIAFTSDLIVGFPGETDEDFQATLNLVREVRFVDCFSFKYSPRPGTGALTLPDGVAPDVAQARLEELQALQRSLTLAAHRERVGERTEVLVAGPSRRGSGQLSGRDPYHRVVNFAAGRVQAAPGTLLSVKIVEATPHSLIGECPGDVAPDTMQRPVERSSGPVDDGERSAVLGA
jgi:tRNA-2-methylthio-N6-dimethylallyladenosine synthase